MLKEVQQKENCTPEFSYEFKSVNIEVRAYIFYLEFIQSRVQHRVKSQKAKFFYIILREGLLLQLFWLEKKRIKFRPRELSLKKFRYGGLIM